MSRKFLSNEEFEALFCNISQMRLVDEKMCALVNSRGVMSADQIAQLLLIFPTSPAKLRVMEVVSQNRLSRMTCEDATKIIRAIPIHRDKLVVLNLLKQALCDHQEPMAYELLLTAFEYENDRIAAGEILKTVECFAADVVPAGGHQGYATVGFLYAQCPPLSTQLYGPVKEQLQQMAGHGNIAVPPQAKTSVIPSIYTGHPSYAYSPGSTYAVVNKHQGAVRWPVTHVHFDEQPAYPTGAPPLGYHSGAPPSVGFVGLGEKCQ